MTETIITVDFEPVGKRVDVAPGTSILEAARLAGLPLTTDCGGAGTCGQCKVIIRQANHTIEEPTPSELSALSDDEIACGYHLACRTVVQGNVKVDIPASSLIYGQRLQMESALGQQTNPKDFSDQVIQSYLISPQAANMHDLRSDLTRVLDTLAAEYNLPALSISPAAARSLSPLLRQNRWLVNALLRDRELVGFLAPDTHPLGLAVDLGTTKIAAYLVDLTTGETLAAQGCPNPQIGYGEDVVSRMAYARSNPNGAKTLAQAVHTSLSEMAEALTKKSSCSTRQIAEVCMVGNTAMTHLLLELPTEQLAMAPYVPAVSTPVEARAADLGLTFAGDCRVYIPPCVAGYVGADLVAMTLASNIGQDGRAALGIDIGTNTEIILAVPGRKRMLALSCASGPAFEGAHIRAGMRAAAGGIERVRLNDGKPFIQTIDNQPAVGICGSGIIDAIAELHRIGAINDRGRFQAEIPGVSQGRDGLEYVLVPAAESCSSQAIAITQQDVGEIQLAKAAIQTGITVLLEAGGMQVDELDEIVLAGAFGTYLNLDTAISIGMLPHLPLERYHQVGNAAGVGAKQIMLSRAKRAQAVEIARQIDYIELMVYPGFRRTYAKAMILN